MTGLTDSGLISTIESSVINAAFYDCLKIILLSVFFFLFFFIAFSSFYTTSSILKRSKFQHLLLCLCVIFSQPKGLNDMQGVAFSLRTLGQVNRRVPTVIYPLLSLLLFPCRVATWPLKFPNWTSSLNWMPQEKSRKKERVLASSVEWLFMSMDTRVTLHTYCIRVVFIVRFVFLLPLTAKMLSRVPFCFSTSQLLDGQKCFCQCIFS